MHALIECSRFNPLAVLPLEKRIVKFSRSQAAPKWFPPKPNVDGRSHGSGYRHTSSPRSVNAVFASTLAMIYINFVFVRHTRKHLGSKSFDTGTVGELRGSVLNERIDIHWDFYNGHLFM